MILSVTDTATCYSGDENSFTYDSNLNFVDDSPNPPPQPPTYSDEFCGNNAYYGYDCPPQVLFVYNLEPCYNQDFNFPQNFQITPVLSTEEPVDSLIIEDEHLDTIPATKSDEVIKSSVENLVPIPSESEGIPDSMCDVPLCNNPTPLEAFKEHSEIVVDFSDDSTSSDDDSPYGEDIDYVDASPPDAEIVSSEVVEIVVPEVGGIDTDILLTIKDDILREKLLNVNLLIAKIDALEDNPTLSSDFMTKSSSTFPNLFLEETNTFNLIHGWKPCLAQAHVFSQATQEPFHIDWYLHAQSLIPAVHMAEHIGGLESTFKIPERIECVRRATSLNFEQNKVIVSALKLNYFVLNFVPVEAIALVIKIPLMRHVKGYNHKIYLHFPRRIVLLYCLPTTHNVVRNHL
ncbi:hypothetical protein Tco_0992043 [Tanacetum coccineum]|uniref:Reverse transcriptase domain-containing protein n=1 Tax=Tanacetum coccineum TaxID=301880 RepID=A0ABQ5F226_9ASTR